MSQVCRRFSCIFTLHSALCTLHLFAAPPMNPTLHWQQLPPLPDREGFATPFDGTSNGALIVAGGANFPEKRPWEGGTKIWYDAIFVLTDPQGPRSEEHTS